jgi:hypothetical protein
MPTIASIFSGSSPCKSFSATRVLASQVVRIQAGGQNSDSRICDQSPADAESTNFLTAIARTLHSWLLPCLWLHERVAVAQYGAPDRRLLRAVTFSDGDHLKSCMRFCDFKRPQQHCNRIKTIREYRRLSAEYRFSPQHAVHSRMLADFRGLIRRGSTGHCWDGGRYWK